MYINLWDWFRSSERKAYAANDTQRLRLPATYYRGAQLLETNRYDEAIAEFEQGRALAHQLDELWW
jgi:hypothetical protein